MARSQQWLWAICFVRRSRDSALNAQFVVRSNSILLHLTTNPIAPCGL